MPSGSINVVPGRCLFSLDLRAPTDAQRDAMVTDVLDELAKIAQRRGLRYTIEESMRAAAAPSAPACSTTGNAPWTPWACRVPHAQRRGARRDEAARNHAAGHAVHARAELGISHNPLESTTNNDIQLTVDAFPGAAPAGRGNPTMTLSYDALDAWIDQHFDERTGALFAGPGARAHRHTARQQRPHADARPSC